MKIIDDDQRKLLERPIEEDTRIVSTQYHQIDGIPFLLERWTWEAIHGRTAVFLPEHASTMSDEALQKFLTERAGIDLCGEPTIERRETHTFVNFGFEAM